MRTIFLATLTLLTPALAGGLADAAPSRPYEIIIKASALTDPSWKLADVYLRNNTAQPLQATVSGCPLHYAVTFNRQVVNRYDAGSICNTALYTIAVPARAAVVVRRGIQVVKKGGPQLSTLMVSGNYSLTPAGQRERTLSFNVPVLK
ncbi:hypothetical protein [Deinococcus multiflagellatus]|uniref:Uncharacterized protein n=1 Tax=Deinococcus multiflagellatus TaxID=1656887 RepID=A0ABW1ZU15_9DEIO|nr:hypothetical protein [Deinococcus multiflagellatus]MBZ9714464.1 hypothetical protein [Deinococcus multiflagellatus]